jgi:hypothetical protein
MFGRLVRCAGCGAEFSKHAGSCPSCGCPKGGARCLICKKKEQPPRIMVEIRDSIHGFHGGIYVHSACYQQRVLAVLPKVLKCRSCHTIHQNERVPWPDKPTAMGIRFMGQEPFKGFGCPKCGDPEPFDKEYLGTCAYCAGPILKSVHGVRKQAYYSHPFCG